MKHLHWSKLFAIHDWFIRLIIIEFDHIIDHIVDHIIDHIIDHIVDHIIDHIVDHIIDHVVTNFLYVRSILIDGEKRNI